MPNQELHKQFQRDLNKSESFSKLSPEEQAEIRTSYLDATDEELILALKEIKKDSAKTKERVERGVKIVDAAKNLQKQMNSIETIQLKKAAKSEKQISEKKAELLLKELENADAQEDPVKKRGHGILYVFVVGVVAVVIVFAWLYLRGAIRF